MAEIGDGTFTEHRENTIRKVESYGSSDTSPSPEDWESLFKTCESIDKEYEELNPECLQDPEYADLVGKFWHSIQSRKVSFSNGVCYILPYLNWVRTVNAVEMIQMRIEHFDPKKTEPELFSAWVKYQRNWEYLLTLVNPSASLSAIQWQGVKEAMGNVGEEMYPQFKIMAVATFIHSCN